MGNDALCIEKCNIIEIPFKLGFELVKSIPKLIYKLGKFAVEVIFNTILGLLETLGRAIKSLF